MAGPFHKHSKWRRGFTLLEILIAIFILGLVLSTVYAAYSSTLRIVQELSEESAIYKTARITLDRMTRDLSSLQIYGASFVLRTDKQRLSNREFPSLFFWSAAHLVFNEKDITGNPANIAYFVREDEGGGSFSLWRADAVGAKPLQEKKTNNGIIICPGIESLIFKFYDANGREYDEWDTSSLSMDQKGKSPTIIKIDLAMVNLREKEKPYKFTTKIFLTARK